MHSFSLSAPAEDVSIDDLHALADVIPGQSKSPAWNYNEQGMNWKMGECRIGNMQSPINISDTPLAKEDSEAQDFLFYSFPAYEHPIAMKSDRLGLVANLNQDQESNAPWIGIGTSAESSTKWNLRQIIAHSPSEHTFGGQRVPLELQLVHVKADNAYEVQPPGNSLAVLSVGFVESALESSDLLDSLRQGGLPLSAGKTVMVNRGPSFSDFNEVIGSSGFWQYQGSLTAPPCSVGVQWFVRDSPLPASYDAVNQFRRALRSARGLSGIDMSLLSEDSGNARAFQPTCERAKLLRVPREAPERANTKKTGERSATSENHLGKLGEDAAAKSSSSSSSAKQESLAKAAAKEKTELVLRCEERLALTRQELQAREKQQEAECEGEDKAKKQMKEAGSAGMRYMRASVKAGSQHTLCESEKKVVSALREQIKLQQEHCVKVSRQ